MSTVVERLTADEFLARDYPRRTELIDGVVMFNQPTWLHQQVCGEILYQLETWRRSARGHGVVTLPLNVVLGTDTVLSPDLLWFAEPLDLPRPDRVPEIVVEVRSRSTWRYDIGRKRELYLQHGVTEVWLVDTASRSVIVYRGDEAYELVAEDTLTSPLLPGFAASVAELIPDPGPSRA